MPRRSKGRFPPFHLADSLHDAPVASVLDLHGFGAGEVPAALRYLLDGHARGKIVISPVSTPSTP